MSALKPGLYRATVRGVADVTVMVTDWGYSHRCITQAGVDSLKYRDLHAHRDGDITDARPLIVLNLEDPAATVQTLIAAANAEINPARIYDPRRGALRKLAVQIEAQTKVSPTEPSDPAARVKAGDTEWAKVGPWWVCADMGEVPREWDYLVDLGVTL